MYKLYTRARGDEFTAPRFPLPHPYRVGAMSRALWLPGRCHDEYIRERGEEYKRKESTYLEERRVESYLRKQIGLLGGICFKFVSPGNAGVPDRIVLLPAPPRIAFVELKAEGGVLSPRQRVQIERIRLLGFDVRVLTGIEQVRAFIDEMQRQTEERQTEEGR